MRSTARRRSDPQSGRIPAGQRRNERVRSQPPAAQLQRRRGQTHHRSLQHFVQPTAPSASSRLLLLLIVRRQPQDAAASTQSETFHQQQHAVQAQALVRPHCQQIQSTADAESRQFLGVHGLFIDGHDLQLLVADLFRRPLPSRPQSPAIGVRHVADRLSRQLRTGARSKSGSRRTRCPQRRIKQSQ